MWTSLRRTNLAKMCADGMDVTRLDRAFSTENYHTPSASITSPTPEPAITPRCRRVRELRQKNRLAGPRSYGMAGLPLATRAAGLPVKSPTDLKGAMSWRAMTTLEYRRTTNLCKGGFGSCCCIAHQEWAVYQGLIWI